MTLQRFQGIVLKLGNQMFVRHYLWLNYPHDPQMFGIELIGSGKGGTKRKRSCECGACQTCKHRQYVTAQRPKARLALELEGLGFQFNHDAGIWTIARNDELAGGAAAARRGD